MKRTILLLIVIGFALVASFAVVAWMLFGDGFSARTQPGVVETAVAHFVLKESVTKDERELKNPVANSESALTEGEMHFADHCAVCHANDGSGMTMLGNGMNPAPPDLQLSATQEKTDGELYSIIQNGVRMSGMPAFGRATTKDLETWKLVLFIRHLPALTAEERLVMKRENPISASERKEQQDEDEFLNGTTKQTEGAKK